MTDLDALHWEMTAWRRDLHHPEFGFEECRCRRELGRSGCTLAETFRRTRSAASVLQKDGRDLWAFSTGALSFVLFGRGKYLANLKLSAEDDPSMDDLGDDTSNDS
jgi:hypothetical protein